MIEFTTEIEVHVRAEIAVPGPRCCGEAGFCDCGPEVTELVVTDPMDPKGQPLGLSDWLESSLGERAMEEWFHQQGVKAAEERLADMAGVKWLETKALLARFVREHPTSVGHLADMFAELIEREHAQAEAESEAKAREIKEQKWLT